MGRYLAVLLFGLLLPVTAFADATPPVVLIRMLPDGSFQIEGQRFTEPKDFKTKIYEIEHRKSKPEIAIVTSKDDADFKSVGRVIWLCQQAGVSKIGFLTEPDGQ